MRTLLCLGVCLAFLAACAASDDAVPPMRLLDAPLVAAASTDAPDTSPASEAGFHQPTDLRFLGDSLVLLEARNSRIVVLGPDGLPRRSVGREGSGPGELRAPLNLVLWNDHFVVGELTGARITFFTRAGAFVRSVPLPDGAASFDVGGDGTLYVAGGGREHYLRAVSPEGTTRPLASRPPALYRQGDLVDGRPAGAGRELVVAAGDGLHVFDNQAGVLAKYDLSGKPLLSRRLPPAILHELDAGRRRMAQDFGGGSGAGIPLAKDLTLTDRGELFLLFPARELFGLLIDPATYEARPLRLPAGKEASRPLYAASSAILRENRVYLFHEGFLSVHVLRETR